MLARTTLIWMLLVGIVLAEQKVVVVVDDSGSMDDRMRGERVRKIDAAKRSLSVVLEKLPADARLGVLALNNGWLMPLQQIDRSQIQQRVDQLRARGGTPLGTRMKEATNELLKLRAKEVYGDYRLLVVTDGEAGDQDVLEAALPDIMSRGILVDVIGVDMDSEHSLATFVHNYRRADDPRSLEEALSSSLAESDQLDSVAGDSDFELLEAFPIELAPVVLSALTSPRNNPIGDDGIYDNGLNSGFPAGTSGSSGAGGTGSGAGGALFGAFFCMVVLFVIISTVSSMFKSVTRSSRPRRRR